MHQPQGGRSALSLTLALTLNEEIMKELACLSVVFLGLSGNQAINTYVPTVSVAAAVADTAESVLDNIKIDLEPLATCKNGQCGKPQATIRKSLRRPRRMFRLFRGRRR